MKIKRNTRKPFVAILLAAIMVLSVFSAMCTSASAATDDEIEASIELGVKWLVDQQNTTDGSWGAYKQYYPPNGTYKVAATGFALVKLEDRSRELGFEPLDPAGPYYDNIDSGLSYLESQKINEDITNDPADKNGNGNAVYFTDESGFHETYSTGIALMAIANSGMLTDDVQDMVDWFIKYQNPDGGWIYYPDEFWPNSDNSNTGYAVLGLAYAEAYGADIEDVKTGLDSWVDFIQNDPGVADDGWETDPDGGSGYTVPDNWVNILKTGNLIFEAGLVGDTADSQRVQYAVDYIVRHWNDPNSDPGWRPNHYQAMYATMKGLEYLQIDEIDGIDWFDEFSTVIVDTQNDDGSWPADNWGDTMLSTEWALLTLEKTVPPKGSITGMKFEDLNANGKKDMGEAVLEGWTITLTDEQEIVVQTMTDENGNYAFTDLADGNYIVGEDMQDGWVQTIPDASGTYEIMIEGGNDYEEIDFGNFKKGKITAGGWIPAPNGPKATFGLVGQYPGNKYIPNGNVEYQDHADGLNIKSIQINTVATSMDMTKGVITGLAQVNGEGAYPFMAYVEDNGEPGKGTDVFRIELPTYSYSNGDILGFGNVQIHK